MDLGKAGVGDDLRQRNVFPIPEITHDEAGSHSDPFWRDLANQAIKTHNELSEGLNSIFVSKKKATRLPVFKEGFSLKFLKHLLMPTHVTAALIMLVGWRNYAHHSVFMDQ